LLGAEPRTRVGRRKRREEEVTQEMGEIFGVKEQGCLLLVMCSIVLYFFSVIL
jgi:hypothetical protein